jgi:diaminobutyrate-2-oxoglutarate transaminase
LPSRRTFFADCRYDDSMTDSLTNAELLQRQAARESNARTYPRGLPIAVGRAQGVEVFDVEGRRYLDFFAGAGVLALGHNHPEVVAAVEQQLKTFIHGLDLPTPVRDAFTTELLETLPSELAGKVRIHWCAPTGSDAVEAAIKLCKRATGRHGVVAFMGSYHGMTAGALSVTSLVEVKERVPSLMPDVSFAPFAYCGRCPLKLTRPACETACAALLETMLTDTHSGVTPPAAAIFEPVQGEGGTIIPPREFVTRIRAATSAAKVPLIADEIQAGFGRTGRFWSFEHFGIAPDVIVTSKALGGIGFPIAAMIYRSELDAWEPGTHIGTFRGHQTAMAAGLAALRIIKRDRIIDNVRARGEELVQGLSAIDAPCIGEVRGLGLMVGVEIVDPETRAPSFEIARAVRTAAFSRGLLCELGGRHDSTLRLLPPLIVTQENVSEALSILNDAFRSAAKSPARRAD